MDSRMYYPLAVIVLMALMGAYVYEDLPDQVPSHWNAKGEIDNYMGRDMSVLLMPVMSLVIYLLFLAIPHISVFRENVEEFYKTSGPGFFTILMLFLFGVYAFTLLAGIGYQLNITYFMLPALAILFGYIGYILPKVKRNFFIGIRNPWTLSSDRVWKKTHEMGGKIFMGSAALMLLALLMPEQAFFPVIIIVVTASLSTFVYSYLEFRKEKNEKKGRRTS